MKPTRMDNSDTISVLHSFLNIITCSFCTNTDFLSFEFLTNFWDFSSILSFVFRFFFLVLFIRVFHPLFSRESKCVHIIKINPIHCNCNSTMNELRFHFYSVFWPFSGSFWLAPSFYTPLQRYILLHVVIYYCGPSIVYTIFFLF